MLVYDICGKLISLFSTIFESGYDMDEGFLSGMYIAIISKETEIQV